MSDMKKMPEDYWKKKLTSEQYHVLREKGTEAPFTGKFDANDEKGMYTCAACGAELFSSENKFHSGSGWPSFDQAVASDKVELFEDNTHGMNRVEARCANCGSHLGHVFDDGPATTGKRFCINSCSLGFEKK
ncbi:MAG: peptide-methionine (R)-S-oxide reductase MsrB [Patescibacteria group bacterium]